MGWFARRLKAMARKCGFEVTRYRKPIGAGAALPPLREEFARLRFAGHALQKLCTDGDFDTVLDIGCGAGEHTELLLSLGKRVTAVDYGKSIYYQDKPAGLQVIEGDFNELEFPEPFDAVWASHVLEHQLDPQGFLGRIHAALREGGWLAITVPPMKHEIVGGHVSMWNGGLLLYRLVLAGFDCREAALCRAGYNISAVLAKRSIRLPEIAWDAGDIDRLAQFFPPGLGEGFQGDIALLNWS